MSQERKLLGFERLIKNLKQNFGKLISVNLIFAVPLLISMGLAYLINIFVSNYLVIYPLALIFSAPFYPGVVVLSRDISSGNFEGPILRKYLSAVKENWLKFSVSGIFLYLAFEVCYFGIAFYVAIAAAWSWIFYIPLVFSVLIVLFFLFFFYAVFLMMASFELKMKAAYKNSALATFGELKHNFFATVSLLLYLMIVFMPVIVISYLASVVPANIIIALLVAYMLLALVLLIPAPCSMIVSHYLYPDMLRVVGGVKDETQETKEEKVEKVREDVKEEMEKSENDIEKYLKGDDDEYVFYNGKMIKRGLLRKLHEQSKGESDDEEI